MKTQEINKIEVVEAETLSNTTEKPVQMSEKDVKGTGKDEPKKEQKISVTYTLKSFGENIKKLRKEELISEEDTKTLETIKMRIITAWTHKTF